MNIDALISVAQDSLRQGDLSKTVSAYRAVLDLDPEHGLANYWLGVLAMKASMPHQAVAHLAVAAAKLPDLPDVQIDLGLACRATGDVERAEECFRIAREAVPNYGAAQLAFAADFERENKSAEAVEACRRGLLLFPQDAGLLRKLADLHFQLNQWRESLQAWSDLLKVRSDCPATHFAFGERCFGRGEFELAAEAFRRTLELRPNFLNALLNLGLTMQRLGDAPSALEFFQRGVEIDPANSGIYKGLGDVRRDLGQWEEATIAWKRAVELNPESADAWQNLGLGLERLERLEEALACHERVVQLRPADATAHRYLGMILQDLGRLDQAQPSYEESLRLDPADAETHWQVFSLQAARGEFPKAWDEHEWRWHLKNRATPSREFTRPKWTGDDLAGRRVLLYAEQGFGDTIMAVRYVPKVKERGGSACLWCPPDLVSLLRTVSGVSEVFSELTAGVAFDCHLPLMSLPLVFRTTLATIPSQSRYLRAPDDLRVEVPSSDGRRPKVGLVWCGSRSQPHDRRPVPFECLALLLELNGVDFYSLQKGTAGLSKLTRSIPERLFDLDPQLTDFAATAAVIEQMDLVITIDTSVAHLAGALGKPTWLLLSFAPDWRWLLEREDSPWYPTMRLFRQNKPGDWREVIDRVGAELSKWVAAYQRSFIWRTWLGEGLAHHQAGRMGEAEESYRRVLRFEPAQADALRLMGIVCRQRGDMSGARVWVEKALAVQPGSPHACLDLGLVCFDSGRLDEAIAAYRKAIDLSPAFPDAHYNLGNAYYALKRTADAQACYLRALELQPDLAEAHYNLGLLSQEGGRLESAIHHYTQAVNANPAHLEALLNLALALKDAGQPDDAEAQLRRLLTLDPAHPKARINLASLLTAKDDLNRAEQICREVLSDCPALAEAWLNLGVVRQSLGDPADAIRCFSRALEMRPSYADARYNLGIAELLLGLFEPGWENYESRWQTENPVFASRGFRQPVWRGEDLGGRRVLVHAEQGLGDAIQFSRYVSMLAERGATVILECPAPLVRLLATVPGAGKVIPRGELPPECDFRIPLMSLPHRLRTTLERIPNRVPYLRAPDEGAARLDHFPSARFKVGIAWAGSSLHGKDRSRSIPLGRFKVLWSVPDVSFFSLQVGPASQELRELGASKTASNSPSSPCESRAGRGLRRGESHKDEPPLPSPLLHPMEEREKSKSLMQSCGASGPVVDLESQLTDFAVTASAIQQLDLVICVDTAVAHLAGAMGKPVWVLIPFAPDWRWLLGREDSPWYPTMRLFRQPRRGDWEPVIERVRAALHLESARP